MKRGCLVLTEVGFVPFGDMGGSDPELRVSEPVWLRVGCNWTVILPKSASVPLCGSLLFGLPCPPPR